MPRGADKNKWNEFRNELITELQRPDVHTFAVAIVKHQIWNGALCPIYMVIMYLVASVSRYTLPFIYCISLSIQIQDAAFASGVVRWSWSQDKARRDATYTRMNDLQNKICPSLISFNFKELPKLEIKYVPWICEGLRKEFVW